MVEHQDVGSAGAAIAGDTPLPLSALAEWRRGWPTVLAAGVGIGSTALYLYSMGLIIVPLQKAFGWSQAQIAAGTMVVALVNFLLAARVGGLADRWGVHRVAVPGFVAFSLSFMALGLAGPQLWSWYLLWALVGISFTTTAPSLWAVAVVTRFEKSRAFALSVALCGIGAAAAVMPFAQLLLLQHGGWRWVYFGLGAGMLIIGTPILILAVARSGQSLDRQPSARHVSGVTFRGALRYPSFWMLALASALIAAGGNALIVYLAPISIKHGLSVGQAATVVSMMGLTAMIGRPVVGALLDRFSVRLIGAVIFALPIAISGLLLLGDNKLIFVAAILLGTVIGAELSILAILVRSCFGTRNYASILGQITATFHIGGGFGPVLAGVVHDQTGSYSTMLIFLMILFCVPPMLLFFVRPVAE